MDGKAYDCLGYIATSCTDESPENNKTSVVIVVKLSAERAEALSMAIKDLNFFTSGEQLYLCFQKNMEELLGNAVEFAQSYLKNGVMTDDIMNSASFGFSRLTLNLLSMFRSFIDHGEAALAKRYGAGSAESEAWKKNLKMEYDRSKAYRFFYNLRNYAQHVGMPPLHFSTDQQSSADSVTISLYFMISELLENYSKWQAPVKKDFAESSDILHLLPMLQDWSKCFHRLVKYIQEVRANEVMGSARTILAIREEFSIPDNGVTIFMPEPDTSEPGVLNLKFRRLPEAQSRDIVDGKFIASLLSD